MSGRSGKHLVGVTVDDAAFDYPIYLSAVVARIREAWQPPVAASIGGERTGVLRFRISRNGTVAGLYVESRSGAEAFDRSEVEAVLRAQPFPPLPSGYDGSWITVHLRFRASE